MPKGKHKKPTAPGKRVDPPGRKSQYRAEYADQARRLVQHLGATPGEVAAFLGKHESTIWLWMSRHPEFDTAMRIGEETANRRVHLSLYQQATGFWIEEEEIKVIEGKIVRVPVRRFIPPNATAAIYWSKVKMKWRDDEPVDPLPGPEEATLVETESDRQIARRLAFTLYRGGKDAA